MNVKNLILGSGTHYGVGFARTTLCGQLGFLSNIAARQSARKDETPVQDAELAAMFGDNGLPTPKVYDLDNLLQGMAAAYVLCVRHARKPDTKTGRINEKMQAYITEPRHWVQRGTDYALDMEISRIKAAAKALSVDAITDETRNQLKEALQALKDQPNKNAEDVAEIRSLVNDINRPNCEAKIVDPAPRIASVKAEITSRDAALVDPLQRTFKQYVKGYIETDDAELAQVALDSYKESGRDIAVELKDGANRILDAQRKAFNEGGKFVEVDLTIYELAGNLPSDTTVTDTTLAAA